MVTTTLYITAHYQQRYDSSRVAVNPEGVTFYSSVIRHATVPAPYQTSDTQPFDHHERGSNRTILCSPTPPGWVFGLPPEGFEGE